MNTICNIRKVFGVWLVEVRTPDGASLLINHAGTAEEALHKARWADVV